LEPATSEDIKDADMKEEAAATPDLAPPKFKQSIIDKAEEFQKSAGLISFDEANQLWTAACDGPGVTPTEFATLSHILSEYKFTKKGRNYLDPLVQKQSSGTSLYKQINKVRYDRSCLDLADHLHKDGRIDVNDAKKLWEDVEDGPGVTETEKRTIEYVRDTMNLTDGAKAFIAEKLGANEEAEDDEEDAKDENAPVTPRKSARSAAKKAANTESGGEEASTPGRRSARERKAPTKFEPPEVAETSSKKGKKRGRKDDDEGGKAKKGKKGTAKKGAKKGSTKKGATKKKSSKKKKTDSNKQVFCCGEPYDDSMFYMGCSSEDKCLGVEWYHGKCVGITVAQSKKLKDWYCEKCKDTESADEEADTLPTSSIFDDGDDEDGDEYSKRMMEEEDDDDEGDIDDDEL